MEHLKLVSNQTQDPDFLDRLINEHEAAVYLGHSVRTLQKWRVTGGGPKFVKVSARSIRYRRCDLNAWVEDRIRSNTSQGEAA
ncbi:MAG: helix-turn-helix domain-containing protein [Magnetococcales bacterium]|nr:helix-turn-helix domain-containing protein [Magnetococcales bacterium]